MKAAATARPTVPVEGVSSFAKSLSSVGAAKWLVDATIDHVLERRQFGPAVAGDPLRGGPEGREMGGCSVEK